jgi:ribosomal protein L23
MARPKASSRRQRPDHRQEVLAHRQSFDELTFRAGRNVQNVQLISADDVNAETSCATAAWLSPVTPLKPLPRGPPDHERPSQSHQNHPPQRKSHAARRTEQRVRLLRRSDATKIDIKQAVEKLFGKKVTGVRTANSTAKPVVNAAPTMAAPITGKKPSSVSRRAKRSTSLNLTPARNPLTYLTVMALKTFKPTPHQPLQGVELLRRDHQALSGEKPHRGPPQVRWP